MHENLLPGQDHSAKTELESKVQAHQQLFTNHTGRTLPSAELLVHSPVSHYRQRMQFAIDKKDEDKLAYLMHVGNSLVDVSDTSVPVQAICDAMKNVKSFFLSHQKLRHKLFRLDFRAADEQVLVTAQFHTPIKQLWEPHLEQFSELEKNINLIGRSRGEVVYIGDEYIQQTYFISGLQFCIAQSDNVFTQPNTEVSKMMLEFFLNLAQEKTNILELYAGIGTFSIPAAQLSAVFATEVTRPSIEMLKHNIKINAERGDLKIEHARLSSSEVVSALAKERKFVRLESTNFYENKFDLLVVDPPRSGLDKTTLDILNQFQNVIYISCNSESFAKNISTSNHRVTRWAAFDQFPHTSHLETINYLEKTN